MYAGTGTSEPVLLLRDAIDCMCAALVPTPGSQESSIRHRHTKTLEGMTGTTGHAFSSNLSSNCWGVKWDTGEFLEAHRVVKASGKFNFEGCKIPIPTPIRYDRIKEALGDEVSPKEQRVLSLLEFGMPLDCNPEYGVKEKQKNHSSAVCFKDAIDDYIRG